MTAIQRASSDLRLNPHFHSLLLDGVYLPTADGGLAFHASAALRQEDVAAVQVRARRRILRYLERRGILAPVAAPGDGEVEVCGDDPLADRDPLLARLLSSAVAGAPPAGPARKVAPIVRLAPSGGGEEPRRTGRLTAELGGFSLHAATRVHAHDARGREAICRYILRAPRANDSLTALPGARVRITLKKAFRDGTTAVELGAPMRRIFASQGHVPLESVRATDLNHSAPRDKFARSAATTFATRRPGSCSRAQGPTRTRT